MSQVFGKEYASAYDILYQEKDYNAECDLIERIIHEYSNQPAKSILDLGCGTGNHTLRLAERGYQVSGVDRSEDMLSIARAKSQEKQLSCEFFQSDIREFRVSKKFDVIIMMFAVLGYHLENEDVLKALQTVREHLNPGGLFICDVWYGPAVLNQKPGERVKVIEDGVRKIIRMSSGELNSYHHQVMVKFHVWDIQGDRVISETREEHAMRYFFAQELHLMFEINGIKIIDLSDFLEINRKPDLNTWNVILIGKKRVT
ncbi:MAG: class I SAM-dependent methyltransferase [Acholeplasma sp.]|nr:class I SAM-dependent methyltransferase [Acholeplasma sp.]